MAHIKSTKLFFEDLCRIVSLKTRQELHSINIFSILVFMKVICIKNGVIELPT